ncbi:hypothetical protein [Streptomyces sp. ADI92-24]|uniref:hypothetical protein n=1 Tax=Streptomyces sp. ADI92-24 TaxID=1522756 RepID=UPI000F55443C|nr:hypothetical protein [Streptomyces sp. ADI92-24]
MSALAVLAFFGISSVGDFDFSTDPKEANRQACQIADDAWNNYSAFRSASDIRAYVDKLGEAADTAADEELKSVLRAHSDWLSNSADYVDDDPDLVDDHDFIGDPPESWDSYCAELAEGATVTPPPE